MEQVPAKQGLGLIISGGQTGVDQGALEAALALGFPCSGWCPSGRKSETGVISDRFPLLEATTSHYPERTRLNVRDSDATLVIRHTRPSRGTALTLSLLRKTRKPFLEISLSEGLFEPGRSGQKHSIHGIDPILGNPSHRRSTNGPPPLPGEMERLKWEEICLQWLEKILPRVLNVAGPRESESPGIQVWTREFFRAVLERCRLDQDRKELTWPPPKRITLPFPGLDQPI